MKKCCLILLVIFLCFNSIIYAESDNEQKMEKAIVLEASDIEIVDEQSLQYVKLKIKSGEYKNSIIEIENHIAENDAYSIVVKEGDKLIVMIDEFEDGPQFYIADFQRSNYILILGILFVMIVLIIGKTKGLKAIVSLTITMICVFFILLPQILKGGNPIILSVLVSAIVTVITIFLVSGVNTKGISAIIGTISGVIIAGTIAYCVGAKIYLTGLSDDEATMLMYIPQAIEFDFKNLLFSGIILGSLGAIMDVAMSISSAIEEIYSVNTKLTKRQLFKSGMNVGKDVMGTMTNTLILAYTGSSIPLLLLFMAYETSFVEVINLDIIATEVVRSLSGSIGLVLTMPITALVSSILISKKHKK